MALQTQPMCSYVGSEKDLEKRIFYSTRSSARRRVNREVQTVNWEAGKKGAVETGVKSGLKKAHKPWIRGKKGAQTVN